MMKQSKITKTELAKRLKNIGPAMAERMITAGIDSPQKLSELGAFAAFDKMYPDGDNYGDFNAAYLHALEGAIRNCDWSEIPVEAKQSHQQYAQQQQKKKRKTK